MKRVVFLTLLLAGGLVVWPDEILHYLITEGSESRTVANSIAEDSGVYRVTGVDRSEVHETKSDIRFHVKKYHYSNSVTDTDYVASRTGNRIRVYGRFKNRLGGRR